MAEPTRAEMIAWCREAARDFREVGDHFISDDPEKVADMFDAIATALAEPPAVRPSAGKSEPPPGWPGEPC